MSDSSDSSGSSSSSGTEQQGHRSRIKFYTLGFKLMIVVYVCWLGWLAYVAWINIQAGNQ